MMKWMGTALAAALLVSGCAKVEGEKFVGHWVNVQTQEETMDIERNGETFMVRSTTPKFFSRTPRPRATRRSTRTGRCRSATMAKR